MDIKAIETVFSGYRFRSRLEARYAVLFEELGVEYQYEPEGYDLGEWGYYLPDFYLPKHNAFIEIKGQQPTVDEINKLAIIGESKDCLVFLMQGLPSIRRDAVYTNWDGFYVHIRAQQKYAFERVFLSLSDNPSAPEEWGNHLVCPMCGFEYVHFEDAVNDHGTDIAGSAWSGRGGVIKIPMWCENGHVWVLRFGFHKGNTYAAMENVKYKNLNFIKYLGEIYNSDACDACNKAKQARFEHSEKAVV